MAAKMLQLRSADGKVLVAPSWDYRPAAAQALPLQMRVPSRALERVLQYWTKHSLAKATGESWSPRPLGRRLPAPSRGRRPRQGGRRSSPRTPPPRRPPWRASPSPRRHGRI
ncbi:hypothetical protein ZWY2020_009493 [Hordeum vulgare]|nr:hypothetical protein ZWY2020_009493 [Hordeum vulgare]